MRLGRERRLIIVEPEPVQAPSRRRKEPAKRRRKPVPVRRRR